MFLALLLGTAMPFSVETMTRIYSLVETATHRGVATTFGTSLEDPLGNPDDDLYCHPGTHLRKGDRAVAARSLPCGTRIAIYCPRTHRSAFGVVMDRGPRRTRGGRLREDLDLSTALARDLRLNGREPVIWAVR
jgi:hypothetical protein